MSHDSNPAGRLLLLLQKVRTQGTPQDPPVSVWENVLEVESGDLSQLLRRLALVLDLPAQIRREVTHLDTTESELAVRHLATIEKLLSNPLAHRREQMKKRITDAAMESLAWTSTRLSSQRPQRLIESADRDRIRDEIQDLLDNVADAALPEDLRVNIVRHLQEILDALDVYEIAGTDEVVRSAQSAIGSILLTDFQRWKPHKKKPWVVGAVKAILQVLILAGALQGALALPETVRGYLPDGVSVVEQETPDIDDEEVAG